jgi:hypothetical protein
MASRVYDDEFPLDKFHSNQAAWSPSWLPTTSSGLTYEKDYRNRDEKRTDRSAPHMELPVMSQRAHHAISNSSHTNYDATAYVSPQDDYPFVFSDPVDGASVQTGMSQQELLRQKARESKKRYAKSKSKKPVVQISGFLISRNRNAERPRKLETADATRPDEIELSTAETTLSDSSLRHRTKSNSSSPLRVVLDGGDLVLTARQSRFNPEFSKRDDDFPLLSRSASGSFQMDFLDPSDSFPGRAYELPYPPTIERDLSAIYPETRSNNVSSNGKPILRTRSAELQSNRNVQKSSSPEWLMHSAEERAEKQHLNRSVRFREDIIRLASFDSKHESQEVPKNRDRRPKSILRESRYRAQSGSDLISSSPSRFIIRKPVTPERKNDQHLVKSPRPTYSPSDVLDETRRMFSPALQDAEIRESSVLSDERYPDPPLDSIHVRMLQHSAKNTIGFSH